jgi:energy-converting hydrogenase Eha subunit G
MFAIIVYVLCAATSGLCAVLLLRGYMKSRARLLFWSGLCFTGLALNNLLLVIDVGVVQEIDLSLWRTVPALIGISLLVYGLVWETR